MHTSYKNLTQVWEYIQYLDDCVKEYTSYENETFPEYPLSIENVNIAILEDCERIIDYAENIAKILDNMIEDQKKYVKIIGYLWQDLIEERE